MKLAFIFLFAAFTSFSQFTIEEFTATDTWDSESKFPIVKSDENAKAAELINISLHYEMLEKPYKEDDDNRFEKVFPPEGEIWGASDFSYAVVANNDRYLCVEISCAYTGAYTEYFSRYFTFDAKSGQRILLDDIFAQSSLLELARMVEYDILFEIETFMEGIDTLEEYGYEQYHMYQECVSWMDFSSLSTESYYITDSTIVFVRGRCSNHMMAALDDLWEFHEDYALEELSAKMNDNGIALVYGGDVEFGGTGVPEGKVLRGKLGGKYPITMILKSSYDNHYRGYYWYDKVKKFILVQGEVDDAAMLHLTESVDDKQTGSFDLMVMSDGSLDGSWESASGETVLDVLLKL